MIAARPSTITCLILALLAYAAVQELPQVFGRVDRAVKVSRQYTNARLHLVDGTWRDVILSAGSACLCI